MNFQTFFAIYQLSAMLCFCGGRILCHHPRRKETVSKYFSDGPSLFIKYPLYRASAVVALHATILGAKGPSQNEFSDGPFHEVLKIDIYC